MVKPKKPVFTREYENQEGTSSPIRTEIEFTHALNDHFCKFTDEEIAEALLTAIRGNNLVEIGIFIAALMQRYHLLIEKTEQGLQ